MNEIYDKKHADPKSFEAGKEILKKGFLRKKKAREEFDTHFTGFYEILKKMFAMELQNAWS